MARVLCNHCGKALDAQTLEDAASEIGRRNIGKRKRVVAGTGRPKKMSRCPKCGIALGVREMRAHKCGVSNG